MIRKKLYKYIIAAAAVMTLGGCSVEPTYYSETVPSTFYDSQNNVWQRFDRPFTHWRWYVGANESRWRLQELGTDEVCLPTRGSDWYNGGVYQQMHHHGFNSQMGEMYNGWYLFSMGVALSWDALEDLNQYVDFDAMGFPKGTRESMLMQQQTLVASFYLDGLDLFGGVPLYLSTKTEVKGRSTDQETFSFIDSLLTHSIPQLPLKTELGALETGNINRAAGAALKARLYFNAKPYIGKEMYPECAAICRDIINGVYGKYELENDWTKIFGFNNETSTEIIWSVPSENSKLQTDGGYRSTWQHYNIGKFVGNLDNTGSNNGYALIPSLKPNGQKYDYKLGGVYSKFEDTDIRKQQYVYSSNGKYKGMFIVGKLVNPIDGSVCRGGREYAGDTINMIDQITYFKRLGTPQYPTVNDLPSTVATAEENSGVRLMKRSPLPNLTDRLLRHNPDVPFIRLAEIYYMLAECEMRLGNKTEAANLINTVRKRYFTTSDPNPVTAANLDKYRMLDEWMLEFLGEGRRRTDLVRWDAYATEAWWDHTPMNSPNVNRFPISDRVMGSNNLLKQNPGY